MTTFACPAGMGIQSGHVTSKLIGAGLGETASPYPSQLVRLEPLAPPTHPGCPGGTNVHGETDDALLANVQAHIPAHHPDLVGTDSREQILEIAH